MNSNGIFIRKLLSHGIGILLAMLLAALLGSYMAPFAMSQMDNDLTKFILGILICLLVGIGTGIPANRTKEKLLGGSSN